MADYRSWSAGCGKVVGLILGEKRLVDMSICWKGLREFRVEVGLISDRDDWQDGLDKRFQVDVEGNEHIQHRQTLGGTT